MSMPVRIGWLSFGPQTCKAVNRRPLRVGIVSWAGFAGGTLVNGGWRSSQGTFSRWLRKPGVDFVELDGAAAREQALRGCAEDENKVDVLWSSIGSWSAEFPQFKKDGIDAVAIAQVASSNNACALIVSERVDGLSGIEGKIITAKWSPAHWLAV